MTNRLQVAESSCLNDSSSRYKPSCTKSAEEPVFDADHPSNGVLFPRRNTDCRRNTPSTRRNAAAPTSPPPRTVVPSARAISMTASAAADVLRDGDDLAGGGV